MKKFEHLIIDLTEYEYLDLNFGDVLNKFSNNGYEFIGFADNDITTLIFKKEIIEQDKYQFASITVKTPMSDEEIKEFAQKLEELGKDGWFIGGFSADAVGDEGLMIFWIQRKIVE